MGPIDWCGRKAVLVPTNVLKKKMKKCGVNEVHSLRDPTFPFLFYFSLRPHDAISLDEAVQRKDKKRKDALRGIAGLPRKSTLAFAITFLGIQLISANACKDMIMPATSQRIKRIKGLMVAGMSCL